MSYTGNLKIKGVFNGSDNRFTGTLANIVDSKNSTCTASSGIFSNCILSGLTAQSSLGTDSEGNLVSSSYSGLSSVSRTFTEAEMSTTGTYDIGEASADGVVNVPEYIVVKTEGSPYVGISCILNFGTTAITSGFTFSQMFTSTVGTKILASSSLFRTAETGQSFNLVISTGGTSGSGNTPTIIIYYYPVTLP